MPDLQYKQFKPKPASQEVNEKPNRKAYSRVLLGDGDSLFVFSIGQEKMLFEICVTRCMNEWMYWLDTSLSGIGSQVVIGETRQLSVNPEYPEDHVLLCFEMMTEQTVSIRMGQSQGAGVGMMIKRAERPAPRLN